MLMGCVLNAVSSEGRIWAILGLCFAVLYAAINSMVYFVQLVVVTPLVFQGNAHLAGMLAFEPHAFMLSLACCPRWGVDDRLRCDCGELLVARAHEANRTYATALTLCSAAYRHRACTRVECES